MFDLELVYKPYDEVKVELQGSDNPDGLVDALDISF